MKSGALQASIIFAAPWGRAESCKPVMPTPAGWACGVGHGSISMAGPGSQGRPGVGARPLNGEEIFMAFSIDPALLGLVESVALVTGAGQNIAKGCAIGLARA